MLLQAQQGPDLILTISMIVGVIALMYFTSIRPQQKRQKEAKTFQEGLKKGQKVVTEGGIHGTLVKVEESIVTVEVESGGRMRLEADQISTERTNLRYGAK